MSIIARCEIERIGLRECRTRAIRRASAAETSFERGRSALLPVANRGSQQKKDDYVEFLHLNSIYSL